MDATSAPEAAKEKRKEEREQSMALRIDKWNRDILPRWESVYVSAMNHLAIP